MQGVYIIIISIHIKLTLGVTDKPQLFSNCMHVVPANRIPQNTNMVVVLVVFGGDSLPVKQKKLNILSGVTHSIARYSGTPTMSRMMATDTPGLQKTETATYMHVKMYVPYCI